VKASGLALGKGVYICPDVASAEQALSEIMSDKIFGESGSTVVIEEYMNGQEVSMHAFSDGHTSALFPSTQDHKRIGTGDVGPNTGGMGAFGPVPWIDASFMNQIKNAVVDPILAGLTEANSRFVGLLYPGLMVENGQAKVVEYNSRFGDPESQVYMHMLETDLVEILNACVNGTLAQIDIKWHPQTAVCVVLASEGYPGTPKKGLPITGLAEADALSGVAVFHGSTKLDDTGQLVTNGGRVLNVTATGANLAEAQAKAYEAVKLIHFDGMQYRTDIGAKAQE
jgi:phosphoribosylamine--glycine ligase